MLRQWIIASRDELTFPTAINRAVVRFGVGRRQAIRYWVSARTSLMSDMQRYRRAFGKPMLRGRGGRFRSHPIELPARRQANGNADGRPGGYASHKPSSHDSSS